MPRSYPSYPSYPSFTTNSIVIIIILIIIIFLYILSARVYNPYYESLANPNPSSIEAPCASQKYKWQPSIYETALTDLYGSANPLLYKNILPNLMDDQYYDKGVKMIMKHFPVHLLPCPSGEIVAVFNDGALYKKPSMYTDMWKGPLPNSMPISPIPIFSNVQHTGVEIPLRMITIAPNLYDYLGVAYDNNLYIKDSNTTYHDGVKSLSLLAPWRLVPNSSNIIYVITDPISQKLIGVSTSGELMIKQTTALDSAFIKLPSPGLPVLKLYYNRTGLMLVLSNKFQLWELMSTDIQKSTQINYKMGANPVPMNDILYDYDGKFFELTFTLWSDQLVLMKQYAPGYLENVVPFAVEEPAVAPANFLIGLTGIILSKTGVNFIPLFEKRHMQDYY